MARKSSFIFVGVVLLAVSSSAFAQQQTVTLPPSYDLRTANPGCLSKIVSQGSCGSCWSVSAATTLSDRICLKGATDLNSVSDVMLSVQEPLSCVTSLSNGCNGGYMIAAWRYFAARSVATCTGACTTGCWPYKSGSCTPNKDAGKNGCSTCPVNPTCSNRVPMVKFSTAAYGQVVPHSGLTQEVALMYEIYTNGPVQTCFTVYDSFYSFFRSYPTGIYTNPTGSSLGGHCVKILGWGEQQGVKYWIAANSWGTVRVSFIATLPNAETH